MREIVYGFDPLCGWCYGLIPAWRHAIRKAPDLPVRVLPGGLITGPRVGPYKHAAEYIRGASERMAAATGQKLSPAFFDLIERVNPISASAPPSHAILQAGNHALAYAHALQEGHFAHGADLSKAETFATLAEPLDLTIDAEAAAQATDDTPLVAEAFAEARRLGITSFPTTLILDGGREVARIDGLYDPARFTDALLTAWEA
ncbi:MAG: DsbA family protein [Shimia sp.]